MPNLVIEVEHKGESKMVGKIIQISAHKEIFFHEESGNQWHKKLDSPGGLDQVLITYLKNAGVREIHHWSKDKKRLFIAPVLAFTRENSQAIEQISGGRARLYLPVRYWKSEAQIPYGIPWVTSTVRLSVKPAEKIAQQAEMW